MAADQARIKAMMQGKTLEKDNIKAMYDMVHAAGDSDSKKNAMKHSVFFVGQLPLTGRKVDLEKAEQIVGTTVIYDDIPKYMEYLFDGLSTSQLLLKKEDGGYEVNEKYENSVVKARKVARAYQMIHQQEQEESGKQVRKMYQMGTRYYHDGSYQEAAACFLNTVEMAEYRMGYYSLAMMYYEGKGVDRSLKDALLYARNAIVRGTKSAGALEQQILSELREDA